MKLLCFTADWCGPCKILKNTLTEMNVPVTIIDSDVDTSMATQYQVRAVPTMIISENDTEVARLVGNQSRGKIESWLACHKSG
jgi:thioredoxin 1